MTSPSRKLSVVWILLCGLVGAGCLASMLHYTGGALSMPLDDSYIFFQYAKRLVQGAPFSYQEGDPATSGLTSWLTAVVHAAGYAVGFRGATMSLFALLVGWGSLVWAGRSLWLLGRRFHPDTAWAGPALLLATGPLVWAAFSGMDFPLFLALALAWAAAWPGAGQKPRALFYVWGSLLGLVRPDAVFLVGLGFLLAWRNRRLGLGWVFPLAFTALPFTVQWILTGSPQSASMDVKSVLSEPGWTLTGWLIDAVAHWTYAVKDIFLGSATGDLEVMHANNKGGAPLYWFPLALVFLFLGYGPGVWAEWRDRRHGPASLLLGSAVLLLAAQSATVPSHWHWDRYLMGVSALALPGVAWGLVRAGRGVEAVASELRPGDGRRLLVGAAVVLSLPGLLYFILAFGKNSADIYLQHIQLARTLNQGSAITDKTVVGVHDVGALAYFGRYRVLDLEGLASRRFQKASRNQAAGAWEALEGMPPGELPRYLAVYSTWFSGDWLAPHRLVMVQRQFDSSIAAGNPMQVYETDWSLLSSGALPSAAEVAPGCRLVLDVDVADVDSESEAGYRHTILSQAYQDLLLFRAGTDGRPVADGGRLVSGGESFTIPGPVSGRLRLVTRSHTAFRVRVHVNGSEAGLWRADAPVEGAWVEAYFDIAAPEGSGPVRIELASDDPYHSAYGSFHYWVYQCP